MMWKLASDLDFVALCIVSFTAGLLYSWGAFGLYIISYISFKGNEVNNIVQLNVTVFSISTCCLSMGQLLGSYVSPAWQRLASFCGGCCLALSIVCFILIPTVWSLIVFMSITLGIASGFLFYVALYYYLDLGRYKKGIITGMAAAFFVAEKVVWTQISRAIVNPENLQANSQGLFPDSVAERVPRFLWLTVYITLGLTVLGIGLLYRPAWLCKAGKWNVAESESSASKCIIGSAGNGKQQRQNSKSSYDDLVSNKEDELVVETEEIICIENEPTSPKKPEPISPYVKRMALFLSLGFCCVNGAAKFLLGNYKLVGFTYGGNTPGITDHSLSAIGSYCGIASCLGRPFWGLLSDMANQYAILLNSAVVTLFAILYMYSAETSVIFLGFTTGVVFFSACTDALWLPFCMNFAGKVHGAKVYGFIVFPARFIQIFMLLGFSNSIGTPYMSYWLGAMAGVGLISYILICIIIKKREHKDECVSEAAALN